MEVKDETELGIRYREIIDNSYSLLAGLKSYYEWIGKKVHINPYGHDKWLLSVELGVKNENSDY